MKTALLSDVCDINPSVDGGIRDDASCSFVPMEYVDDISGIITKSNIRRVGDVKKGYTFFKDGDVIFAKITPCMENGKCALAKNLTNEIAFGSTEFHVVRARNGIIPEWIYYFLRQEKIRQQATLWFRGTAGQQRVPSIFIKELEIPLPPLPEQRRIAAILGKADRLRRLRRTARQLGESFLQSVFVEMFGNGRRFELAEFVEILSEDPKNGLYLPAEQYGSGIPIIRIDAFYDGILGNPNLFKRVRTTPKQAEEFEAKNGDILINRVNSMEYLGKCAFVEGLTEPTLFESNMMRIRINRSLAHPIYVTKFLTTQRAYFQILQRAKKAVNQASINQEDVKSFQIPIPPLTKQERFVTIVRRCNLLVSQQHEAERQAEMLFQALLQRAFAGEL